MNKKHTKVSTLIYCVMALCVTLYSPLSYSHNQQHYPLRWTKDVPLNSLQDISAQLARPVVSQSGIQLDKNGKTATIVSCKDYLKYVQQGYEPISNAAMSRAGQFKVQCQTLTYLKHAHVAHKSYIREFKLSSDYKQLPGQLIFPPINPDEPLSNASLLSLYPDTKVLKTASNRVELSSQTAKLKAVIQILAWGDFNRDGIDDILLLVASYAQQGSYRDYQIHVITRQALDKPINVLKLPLSSAKAGSE